MEFDHRGQITIDLVAKDETVATGIVDQLTQMTDKSGKPIFTARTGKASESADKVYPVKDQVNVEIVALKTTS